MDARTIVLTGASRGLGRAMADRFVEMGHTVHACARSAAAMDEISQSWPASCSATGVDVAADAPVRDWAERILAAGSVPDLLINNAALINRNARLWEVPVDEFSAVIDVNIKGVTNVIRHFVPAMIERRRGVIVNFSSGWGRSVAAQVAPYCATKWAVEGLTKALAEELPDSMAAVPLGPGAVHTDMLESCYAEHAHEYPSPEEWVDRAAGFILALGARDNGESLSVPR